MSWDKLCVHKLAGGMGFRKFHEFNLAMLGKQGWRLLQKPSSLVAQIFKARYYHSSSFLEANIGPNPSYVWRSVLASQELIRRGVRRRIGSGEKVNIWSEPWLPDLSNPMVETPKIARLEQATVSSLISTKTTKWDDDILNDIKNLILKIPLSISVKSDSWFWIWERRGCYTVKSGYRFLAHSSLLFPSFTAEF